MRSVAVSGAALAMALLGEAKEIAKSDIKAEMYDSGRVHMDIMDMKMQLWLADAEAGLLDSSQHPRLNYTKCINGKAEAVPGNPLYTFGCKNIDLYDFINHAELGSPEGWDELGDGVLLTGSGSWGWTDPVSGRVFIANGMYAGTAFLEILTEEGRLRHVGFLPCPAPTDPNALWKEIRGYKNYMLIGSELRGHGVQIFDMSRLLDVAIADMPVRYDAVADLAGRFMDLPNGQTHNVVVNEESGFGLAVGARPRTAECQAGLIMFDLKDPSTTTTLGCNGDDGYVHDAQCVVYRGPDTQYVGHDICYGFNEDTLTIYDVTNKVNSSIISITSYEGAAYTHQGWLLDPNWQQWLLMDDEYDEEEKVGPAQDQYPVTYIWDISSLASPKQTGLYKGTVPSIDHNQYVRDKLVFQSNYAAGLRVYDISSIPEDPTGDSVCEVAYFDIYPEDDGAPGGGEAIFYGTWSSYAVPNTPWVFINTIERGAYLVKLTRRDLKCPRTHPCNADNCLRAMRASSIEGRLEESQEFCADFTDGWSADVAAVPAYASSACGTNVVARVSSACSCLPTPTPTA